MDYVLKILNMIKCFSHEIKFKIVNVGKTQLLY